MISFINDFFFCVCLDRFDFSHGKALTGPQLEESEAIVQRIIQEEKEVYNQVNISSARDKPRQAAVREG